MRRHVSAESGKKTHQNETKKQKMKRKNKEDDVRCAIQKCKKNLSSTVIKKIKNKKIKGGGGQ